MRSLRKNNLYLKFSRGSRRIIVYDSRNGTASPTEQILFARIYNWMGVYVEKTRTLLFGESGRLTGRQSHLPPLRSLSVG